MKEEGLDGITNSCMPSGSEPHDMLTRGASSSGGAVATRACMGGASFESCALGWTGGLSNDITSRSGWPGYKSPRPAKGPLDLGPSQ
jgi:hypothetical protein